MRNTPTNAEAVAEADLEIINAYEHAHLRLTAPFVDFGKTNEKFVNS